MRAAGKWGTAKIQQGLLNLPKFMRIDMGVKIQGVKLSRQAINNVLRKHSINGYLRKSKAWKFFRAKKPDELWQLDLKGPFKVEGKKYWILVCIDDYSRYIVSLHLFDHSPTIVEIENSLKVLIEKHKPENILTDNNPFKESWARWCKSKNVEPLFAHPYYPQDKGRVERAIRTLTEEFIHLLKKFSHWLKKGLQKWKNWYNHKRYHRGIDNVPANLYG